MASLFEIGKTGVQAYRQALSVTGQNVANQFEAIFVHQMLKQARQGKLADGIFNSEAQDTFNNMLDIEYSQILSKKNNFGIAEALIQQFQPQLNSKKVK